MRQTTRGAVRLASAVALHDAAAHRVQPAGIGSAIQSDQAAPEMLVLASASAVRPHGTVFETSRSTLTVTVCVAGVVAVQPPWGCSTTV